MCPNCYSEIKSGFLASNQFLDNNESLFIREFTDNDISSHCQKCGPALKDKAVNAASVEMDEKKELLTKLIESIPIISIHNPYGWRYQTAHIVTGQSVTGTGVFSEISSSFTDLFGMQSGSFAKKLAEGELFCMNQLRVKAVDLGCNAIIGTDIDYSEVGSIKGMLMVCMAGTAVVVENMEDLGYEPRLIERIKTTRDRMSQIKQHMPKWVV